MSSTEKNLASKLKQLQKALINEKSGVISSHELLLGALGANDVVAVGDEAASD